MNHLMFKRPLCRKRCPLQPEGMFHQRSHQPESLTRAFTSTRPLPLSSSQLPSTLTTSKDKFESAHIFSIVICFKPRDLLNILSKSELNRFCIIIINSFFTKTVQLEIKAFCSIGDFIFGIYILIISNQTNDD